MIRGVGFKIKQTMEKPLFCIFTNVNIEAFVYLQYLGKYTDDFDQLDEDCFKYATINFDTGEIDCSETFNEFADKISDENILNLDKWNATKPSPSGAEFPK